MANRKDDGLESDEFDIELLFTKLYQIAARVLNWLVYPIRLLFLKPLLLLFFVLLAGGIAFIVKNSLPKIYKASFIIKPFDKADLFYVNLVSDLERIISDKDFDVLAGELNITKEMAYHVNMISLKPIRLGAKSMDTIDIAEIEILSSNISLFDTIQIQVMKYIRENEHYSKIKRLRIAQLEGMKQKLSKDLLELDSLKRQLITSMQPRNTGGFVYGEPIDPIGIYEGAFELYKEQSELIWQEEYVDNFEVIKDCVPTKKPVYPVLYKIILFAEVIALFVLLCWNYFWVRRK